MLKSAEHLNLINHVDEKTGASVGMWNGVQAAPIEWGKFFREAAPTACLHAGCHPGRCVYGYPPKA